MVFDYINLYFQIVCVFDGNLRPGSTQYLDFHKSAFLSTLFFINSCLTSGRIRFQLQERMLSVSDQRPSGRIRFAARITQTSTGLCEERSNLVAGRIHFERPMQSLRGTKQSRIRTYSFCTGSYWQPDFNEVQSFISTITVLVAAITHSHS